MAVWNFSKNSSFLEAECVPKDINKYLNIYTFHLFLFFYRYAALYISDAGLSKSKSEESMERCLLSSLITECDQIM